MNPVEEKMKEQADEAMAAMESEGGAVADTEPPEGEEFTESSTEATKPVEAVETVTIRPKFPLRMAVIGAPFSGKAEFQEAFADVAGPYFAEHDSELRVLPNGAASVEALGLAVGFFGGYREHMMAFFSSLEAELAAQRDGVSFLLNGTLLGNMAHAGANHEAIMLGLDKSGIVTPDTAVRMQEIQATIMLLNSLMSGFRTQFVFRLPLAPAIEVPGQDVPVERRHAARVDFVLGQILDAFGLNVRPLEAVGAEERAREALATVERLVEEGTQVPRSLLEQLGTPPEGEDG